MKFFISILVFLNILYSASIDTNFTSPKPLKTYNKLLVKLKTEPNKELEKKILYKLINITSNQKEFSYNLAPINNEQDYIKVFWEIYEYKSKNQALQNNIESTQKRLTFLENKISSMTNRDQDLLISQLQYAFYFQTFTKNISKYKSIEQNFPIWIKQLNNSLKNIIFNTKNIEQNIKKTKDKLSQIQIKKTELTIEKERVEFIQNQQKIDNTDKQILDINKKQHKLSKNLITYNLILFLNAIQNKNQIAYDYAQKIETDIQDSTHISAPIINQIITSYLSETFGNTNLLIHYTQDTLKDTLKTIYSFITHPIFSISEKTINIINIFISILILIIGFYLGSFYKRKMKTLHQKYRNININTQNLMRNLGYYFIVLISIIMSLTSLGIDLSSLTLIAGALSVGIGFGLKNIVSNFISGMILMFEKSIKIGDYIEVDEINRGRVVKIKMRATTIKTNNNIDIVIPNLTFIEANVTNWTLSSTLRRFKIPFSVAYGNKIENIQKIVLDALYESDCEFIRDNPIRVNKVIFTKMNDSSLDFMLNVWVKGEKAAKPGSTQSEFLTIIYNALRKNNISIPFPQLDVHLQKEA